MYWAWEGGVGKVSREVELRDVKGGLLGTSSTLKTKNGLTEETQ